MFNVILGVLALKQCKQLRVSDDAGLERLGQAVDDLTAGQGLERVKIDKHDLGCQNAPTMFFVSPKSIAVLPPMEESTCESTVVGS